MNNLGTSLMKWANWKVYGTLIIVTGISLMLFTTGVYSQDIRVAAEVTPRHIQLNEKTTMKLTISGRTEIKHIGSPIFNFMPDILTVPLHSETTPRLVKDKINVSMAWFFELIPQKIGEIALSDIQFTYQGVPYYANPGKIIVAATDTYVNNITGGVHKVQAEVSNNKPYVNEPILYRFRYLWTTLLPSLDPPTPKLPTFNDFFVEVLPDEKNGTIKMKGRTYKVHEYVRRLYPKITGKVLIQPAQMKLFTKNSTKTLKTKPIPLNIRAFPEVGKPKNFTGAIGQYHITAKVDHKKIEVRKAITLSLHITGDGNINTVSAPHIPAMNGFRTEPQNLKTNTNDNNRVYTYVLTPLKAEVLLIPAIEYPFFNPNKRSYQITKTSPIPITVVPDRTDEIVIESDFPMQILWLCFIGLLIIGCAIGGYLMFRSRFKLRGGPATTDPSMSPATQTLASLDNIINEEAGTKDSSFSEELTRNLHEYICEQQGMAYRQLTTVEVRDICSQIGVSNTIQNELTDILEKCQYHRFAPVPLSAEERKELISRAEIVIKHLAS